MRLEQNIEGLLSARFVAAGEVVSGYPAIPNRLWLRCSAAFNKLPELARALRQLEKQAKP